MKKQIARPYKPARVVTAKKETGASTYPNSNSTSSISSPGQLKVNPRPRQNPFHVKQRQVARGDKRPSNIMNEIYKLQSSTNNLIPKQSFSRLVQQICQESINYDVKWTSLGLQALQTAAQQYLTELFEDSYLCAIHCKRVTLMQKDLQLARRIRGPLDPGNR